MLSQGWLKTLNNNIPQSGAMESDPFSGIGEKTLERLLDAFGSKENILAAATNYRLDELAAINGISRKRAVSLVKTFLGMEESVFFGSPKADKIYQDILGLIQGYASTPYGRNRVELLVPLESREEMEAKLEEVMGYHRELLALDTDALRRLLRQLKHFQEGGRAFAAGRVVVAESDTIYTNLMEAGLGNHIRVATPGEFDPRELEENYELALYVYEQGNLDFGNLGSVVELREGCPEYELVPQRTIAHFKQNLETIQLVKGLFELLGQESAATELLELMGGLDTVADSSGNLAARAKELKNEMNTQIEEAISKMELKGQEIIDTLAQKMPERIRAVIQEQISAARATLREEFGQDCSAFKLAFPVELDDEELERGQRAIRGAGAVLAYNKEVQTAGRLQELKEKLLEEIDSLFRLDYRLALALFIENYQLRPFVFGEYLEVHGGLHLELLGAVANGSGGEGLQRIHYHLGKETNTAILTGANSGGKTTLMEMVAQQMTLAHMGLPVPAKECVIPIVEELILYSPEKALNAGAFESFLLSTIPILTNQDQRRFILMDEIEAITELEAASKIIATFLDCLKASPSLTIIVTHMAQDILRNADVRVDGIEAKGLDENYQLVVDRTPRIGHYASSTPELIIRRLHSKSSGKEKEIFAAILDRFKEN